MATRIGDCDVRFGIAGWSYPDWEGVVYPPGTRDRLRYLAGFVDLIEINASFYAFMTPANAEDWLARTADLPDLRFAAKANRAFTHEPVAAAGPAQIRVFRAFLEPLRREGRLAAVLFQFPFPFRDRPDARDRLERLACGFGGLPRVVELRHASWADPAALEFLRRAGLSVASLDFPAGSRGFPSPTLSTSEPGYLRLHGRNAADWFRPEAGRDARYDYLYGDEELEELADRIEELARRFRQLIVVTNNHYRGQALANLAELRARAGGGRRPLPAPLLRAYPRLAAVAFPALEPSLSRLSPEPGSRENDREGPETSTARPRTPTAQRDLFEG